MYVIIALIYQMVSVILTMNLSVTVQKKTALEWKRGKLNPQPKKNYKKARKKRAKLKITDGKLVIPEETLQSQCEEYLDWLNLKWFHIPQIVYSLCKESSSLLIGHKRAISDALKGKPDLMIFFPTKPYTTVLQVELKVGKNDLTHAQRDWLRDTTGYKIKKFSDFKELVDKFVKECDEKNIQKK